MIFSVITPCYKRGIFLPNVWSSLLKQSVEIEWIVGIDGENDDAFVILEQLGNLSMLDMKVLRYTDHVGKTVIDNAMISYARGDYIVWCDSDDYFKPYALDAVFREFQKHSVSQTENTVGCVGPIADFIYKNHSALDGIESKLVKFEKIWSTSSTSTDYSIILKADALKKHLLPEVDFYYPEGAIWEHFHNSYVVLLNLPIRFGINHNDGITRSSNILYPRSKALVFKNLFLCNKDRNSSSYCKTLWYAINFYRFSFHADQKSSGARVILNVFKVNGIFVLLAGLVLVVRDQLKGNVIKTHREFDKSNKLPSSVVSFRKDR